MLAPWTGRSQNQRTRSEMGWLAVAALLLMEALQPCTFAGMGWVAVAALFLERSSATDKVCGLPVASSFAWIDVPTYWLNLDRAVARATRMREQLPRALTPGTCALRVRAVDARLAWRTVSGNVLFINERDELRFTDSQLTRLAIATTLSHLRAAHIAAARGDDVFLVLEDDVDLYFFPMASGLAETPGEDTATLRTRPAPLLEARSARALVQKLPSCWAILQLMTIQSRGGWRRLHKLWRAAGSRRASTVSAGALAAAYSSGTCPSEAWSAGAYLSSAEAAARWTATWPLELRLPSGARSIELAVQSDEVFRVRVTRVPWVRPCWQLWAQGPLPLTPNFAPDVGYLHMHQFYGPARSIAEAHALGAAASTYNGANNSGAQGECAASGLPSRLREFLAVPPLVISFPVNTSDMGSLKEASMHVHSLDFVKSWWAQPDGAAFLASKPRQRLQRARSQMGAPPTVAMTALQGGAAPHERVAFVLRAHAQTPRLWRELRRYARELQEGHEGAAVLLGLFASVDTTRPEGKAFAHMLAQDDAIGSTRLHTYDSNATLAAFSRSMAHLRLHLRESEPNVNWAFHVEPMALWARWAELRGIDFTHAWFVEADVGFSGHLSAFLRATEQSATGCALQGRATLRAATIGGSSYPGNLQWTAAKGGARAVSCGSSVESTRALSDLLGFEPLWISGNRYGKYDKRFWAHWQKCTPAFQNFFANAEQRYRGAEQVLRISKRLLLEMAHLSADLGVRPHALYAKARSRSGVFWRVGGLSCSRLRFEQHDLLLVPHQQNLTEHALCS